MKFSAAAIALAGALSVDAAVLGERATYAVKGKPEGTCCPFVIQITSLTLS